MNEEVDQLLLLDDMLGLSLGQIRLNGVFEGRSRHLRSHVLLNVLWPEVPLLNYTTVPTLE